MNTRITLLLLFICYGVNAKENHFLLKDQNTMIDITTKDLEKMPSHDISTSTNFTPKCVFTGVEFIDLLTKFSIHKGTTIRVFAMDDYSYSIPVSELFKYHTILAYKKNHEYINTSDLGPYAIIFPRDEHPELNIQDINAKTVWQIKKIELQQ
jgi:hypothetical protein